MSSDDQINFKVIRDAEEDEIQRVNDMYKNSSRTSLKKPIDKGWIVTSIPYGVIYQMFPNYTETGHENMNNNYEYIIFDQHGRFINYTNNRPKDRRLHDTIDDWELKKNLSSDTKESFGDLIDIL
jgi:hypothetical protein